MNNVLLFTVFCAFGSAVVSASEIFPIQPEDRGRAPLPQQNPFFREGEEIVIDDEPGERPEVDAVALWRAPLQQAVRSAMQGFAIARENEAFRGANHLIVGDNVVEEGQPVLVASGDAKDHLSAILPGKVITLLSVRPESAVFLVRGHIEEHPYSVEIAVSYDDFFLKVTR